MIKRNILILYSFKEDAIENRINFLKNSLFFQNYNLNIYYIKDLFGEKADELIINYQSVKRSGTDPTSLINIKQVEENLEEIIQIKQPSIIIIHSGILFHLFFETILEILMSIKRKYPKVEIGVENISQYSKIFPTDEKTLNNIIANTEEIRLIMKNLYFRGDI